MKKIGVFMKSKFASELKDLFFWEGQSVGEKIVMGMAATTVGLGTAGCIAATVALGTAFYQYSHMTESQKSKSRQHLMDNKNSGAHRHDLPPMIIIPPIMPTR
jgi:hypothetical protein